MSIHILVTLFIKEKQELRIKVKSKSACHSDQRIFPYTFEYKMTAIKQVQSGFSQTGQNWQY